MAAVPWPTETQAQNFNTLDNIRVFVGLTNAALRSVQARVGDLNNQYTLLASISADALNQSM